MTNNTNTIINNEEETKMKNNVGQKLMAAFAAAGVTADEFFAAAAAEKEALRVRRARKATARAIAIACKAAAIRRETRKQVGIEKEARRAARRIARRAARRITMETAHAWAAYVDSLKEETVITAVNSFEEVNPIIPAYGDMVPENTGVASPEQLAICRELYGDETGKQEALFVIPGTDTKAVSCETEGVRWTGYADIVITDNGTFSWHDATENDFLKSAYSYNYGCDREYTVGEFATFTLENGETLTVVMATSSVLLLNAISVADNPFVSFGEYRTDKFAVTTQEDFAWVLRNCNFVDVITGYDDHGNEIVKGAEVSLIDGAQMPEREERIITFTLEELLNARQWDSKKFSRQFSVVEVDDDTPLNGEVKYCPECGFYSEPHGDGTEYDEDLHEVVQVFAGDVNKVVSNGDKLYWVNEHTCEHCVHAKSNAAVAASATVEEALKHVQINERAICPNCGKMMLVNYDEYPSVTVPTQVLYRLNGNTVESFVVSTTECQRCKTLRYGAGLDGVKDDITVNHGLWAFRKDENNVHGALRRFREFLQLSKTAEFCATESTQFCGDFGVTIEHPNIVAAFGYCDGDAWSERDGEQRYATANFEYGITTKATFDEEVAANLEIAGNGGNRYVELIVSMGKTARITRMWIKVEFFIGHPHFSRALCEVAEDAGLDVDIITSESCYVNSAWMRTAVLDDGLNAVVSHYTVKDAGDDDYDDSWSLGHTDDDRVALRYYLFNLLVDKVMTEDIARDRKAIVLCGLPGSGKSTIARQYKGDYAVVDPDVVKWLLPEYNGGDASFVHRESTKIASWVNQYLAIRGFNVVVPMIGDNDSLRRVKHVYEEAGYEVEIRFVGTDPATCHERIQGRNRSIDISMEALQESYDKIVANINDLTNPY